MMKLKNILMVALLLLVSSVMHAQDSWEIPLNRKGFHAEGNLGYVDKGAFFNASAGYVPVRGLFLGGGVGVRHYDISHGTKKFSTMVPVFAQVKYVILNKKVSPFVDMKGGFMSDYTCNGTGWFYAPSIGVSAGRLSLSVGIDVMRCSYSNLGANGFSSGDNRFFIGLSFSF